MLASGMQLKSSLAVCLTPPVSGLPQVHAMLKDAAAAQAVGWPPELHIAKTLARSAAESFLESKRSACLLTRLKIQFASAEAQVCAEGALPGCSQLNGELETPGCSSSACGTPCCCDRLCCPPAQPTACAPLPHQLCTTTPTVPGMLQSIPRRLLGTNAAGAVSMPGNYIGVLLPKQHPTTQQVRAAWHLVGMGRWRVLLRPSRGPCLACCIARQAVMCCAPLPPPGADLFAACGSAAGLTAGWPRRCVIAGLCRVDSPPWLLPLFLLDLNRLFMHKPVGQSCSYVCICMNECRWYM